MAFSHLRSTWYILAQAEHGAFASITLSRQASPKLAASLSTEQCAAGQFYFGLMNKKPFSCLFVFFHSDFKCYHALFKK